MVDALTFENLIGRQPELNRLVGSFLGAEPPGLTDQIRMSKASRVMSGVGRLRLWCLTCMSRWHREGRLAWILRESLRESRTLRLPDLSSPALAADERPFEVCPQPGTQAPFGW